MDPITHPSPTLWLLPRRAVQRCGRAAGEVLFDALVVPNLRGHGDWGGLSARGHHWGLPRDRLRLPAGDRMNRSGEQVHKNPANVVLIGDGTSFLILLYLLHLHC